MKPPVHLEKIRSYLKAMPKDKTASCHEISFDCSVPKRVCQKILAKMVQLGEIERIEAGQYRSLNSGVKIKQDLVRDRIYRAISNSGTFSYREIRILTGANSNYIEKIVKKLLDDDDLERMKMAKNSETKRPEVRFRVRWPDKFWSKRVLRKGGDDEKNT